MSDNEETRRLWRIRKTTLQMLRDRNYLVSVSELDLNFAAFSERFGVPARRPAMTFSAPKKDDPTDQIIIFFAQEAKIGVKELRDYISHMDGERIKRGILVLQNKLTSMAKQVLLDVAQGVNGTVLEQFHEGELLVNITEHVLVPKHVVMTMDEKAALLKRYKLQERQLPRMLENDPIARYYGLGCGAVVKIIRPSETAGNYVTYRLVVEA